MKRLIILFSIILFSACGKGPESMENNNSDIVRQALACDSQSGTYCGQPPMPACPPNVYCIQVMPTPQTYANDCTMKDAGATFIQAGSCPTITL